MVFREYVRVFADAGGESHIERCQVTLESKQFAPPAPPVNVSAMQPASGFALLDVPVDWWGEWHPTPFRQWLLFLSGSATIQASDGFQCEVAAGEIILLEDTGGRGHQTRIVGGQQALIASVRAD